MQQADLAKSVNVLLAEDDPVVRRLASLALKHYGYQVFEASTGSAVLEILESQKSKGDGIHIVVADVVMPDFGAEQIAEYVTTKELPTKILVTSGYSRASLKARGEITNDAYFLPKPFSAGSLVRSIREMMDTPDSQGNPVAN